MMDSDWQLAARPTAFEWDPAKADANRHKHGLSFIEAIEVFLDPRLRLLDATRPSDHERRVKALGMVRGRLYAVTYTWRGSAARIISARRTNRKEDRDYGQDRPLSS